MTTDRDYAFLFFLLLLIFHVQSEESSEPSGDEKGGRCTCSIFKAGTPPSTVFCTLPLTIDPNCQVDGRCTFRKAGAGGRPGYEIIAGSECGISPDTCGRDPRKKTCSLRLVQADGVERKAMGTCGHFPGTGICGCFIPKKPNGWKLDGSHPDFMSTCKTS